MPDELSMADGPSPLPARVSLPAQVPAGVEVWRLELDLPAPLASGDWALLDAGERARAQRFHRHADRLRLVAGRAALRRLLASRVGGAPDGLRFGAGPYGKPFLDGRAGLAFNVAHSATCVLIAVDMGTVHTGAGLGALGVDVERHAAGHDLAALAAYALGPEERRALAAAPDPVAAFFQIWSAKEAAFKALGVGLGEHLQRLRIELDPQPGLQLSLRVRHDVADWGALQACTLPAPANFSAALAWRC